MRVFALHKMQTESGMSSIRAVFSFSNRCRCDNLTVASYIRIDCYKAMEYVGKVNKQHHGYLARMSSTTIC
jgi:hypothetical protein